MSAPAETPRPDERNGDSWFERFKSLLRGGSGSFRSDLKEVLAETKTGETEFSPAERAMLQNILDPTRPHEVHVRMVTDCDAIETVDLVVVPRDEELDEIDLDRHVLGYIQQAGRVFVALVGERLDRAEECGQSLLWDKAAADLVRSARLAEASSQT